MKDLVLIPYIKVNGAWTLPDEVIKGLYNLMVKENTAKIMFPSGNIKNGDDFLKSSQLSKVHTLILLKESGEPAAIGWLNNFDGDIAHAHWLCFKSIWGTEYTDKAIRQTLEYWFHFKKDGKPLFEVLLGVYPEDNKFIDGFAKKSGFTVIGIVPKLLYNYWESRRVGAVISYIERGTICHS